MTQKSDPSTAALWARFRFSVVGSLLSAPPAPGELKVALGLLAEKTWTHPVSGGEVRFGEEIRGRKGDITDICETTMIIFGYIWY